MEMNAAIIWDAIIAIFIPIAILVVRQLSAKIEKTEELVARTREEYATKYELRENMAHLMEAMHRLEDKLDKILSRGN